MVTRLDAACHESTDIPNGPALVVAQRVRTGNRGRPKLHIDYSFLAEALTHRGPTGIAPVLGCSSRTIRRRALELSLAVPARPVFQATIQANGHTTRTYNAPQPRPPPTTTGAQLDALAPPQPPPTLTDTQLDALVLDVLTVFPAFGRSMLAGHLTALGVVVQRERLRDAYNRVNGTPVAWGNRFIDRRGYHVAGANSLWHHDGQHGRYSIPSMSHYSVLILSSQVSSSTRL